MTTTRRRKVSERWLRVDEILTELGVSRRTWQDWRADGRAPRCIKLPNGQLRIDPADYSKWKKQLEAAAENVEVAA